MKTKLTGMALLIGWLSSPGSAPLAWAETAASAPHEKSLKGEVVAVNPIDKSVQVKGFLSTKRFNMANDCQVIFADKPAPAPAALRPGQEVEVKYENAQGVLVAHRIVQHNQTYEGYVRSIDPTQHVLTVRRRMLDKDFRIANDCRVLLGDDKSGELADLRPGHHVKLVYETPDGSPTVRHVSLVGRTFNGTITAIDLNEQTLKAKAFLGSKKFNLANNCRIVIDGKTDAALRDLRIGDRVAFNYEDVGGVLVANRVGRESGATPENIQAAKTAEFPNSRPLPTP
jgi:Cu/Ag efflux protein CusF